MYVLYVDISLKDRRVYFYDEYDCGGKVHSYISDIPDSMDVESFSFIQWLRDEIEDYV